MKVIYTFASCNIYNSKKMLQMMIVWLIFVLAKQFFAVVRVFKMVLERLEVSSQDDQNHATAKNSFVVAQT
jgi:ABC-type siderophore export system fused ATPase/permease subunit